MKHFLQIVTLVLGLVMLPGVVAAQDHYTPPPSPNCTTSACTYNNPQTFSDGSIWGPSGPTFAKPAYTGDLSSFRAEAPRQSIMTLGNGAMKPQPIAPQYTTLSTFLLVMPIEATANAVRIGFTNPFNTTEDIVSVGIYPSDSYSGPATNISGWDASTTEITAIPTANSVYLSCALTNGSTAVSCPGGTSTVPTGTVYAIAAGVPFNATVTCSGTSCTLSGNATCSGAGCNVTLQFANLASECKEYFDNAGADVDNINASGTNRGLIIPANPNGGTGATSFVFNGIGDFVPCNSVAQVNPSTGNTTNLLFIYVTVGPSTDKFSSTLANLSVYNASPLGAAALSNRYIFSGLAWTGNIDYADNPVGAGFKGEPVNPIQIVQYVTAQRGWNVVQLGDSISQAPPDDNWSSWVFRACKLLSTPQAPCEWTSFAQGGEAWAQYGEALRSNIEIVRPSAVVGQPISRNEPGGVVLTSFQTLLARTEAAIKQTDARLGFYGAFPLTTTCDGSTSCQQGVASMRAILAAVSKTCQPSTHGQTCPMIPVLDPVPYISALPFGGNPWDYPATSSPANGATAAGATSIAITTAGTSPAYPNWKLRDITTPAAVASGCIISASSSTAITVPNTCVVGSGIQSGDELEFAIPGFTMGNYGDTTEGFSADNTHPWYPAQQQLIQSTVVSGATPAITFMQQLLGMQ